MVISGYSKDCYLLSKEALRWSKAMYILFLSKKRLFLIEEMANLSKIASCYFIRVRRL